MNKIKVWSIGKFGMSFQKWKQSSDDNYRYYRYAKFFIIRKSLHTIPERYKTLLRVRAHCEKIGMHEKDLYQAGMYNGLAYAIAILEGKQMKDVKLTQLKQEIKMHSKDGKSRIILPGQK